MSAPGGLSLYRRVTGLVAAVMAVTGIGLGVVAASYARGAADDAYDRLMVAAALQIAESVYTQDGRLLADPPFSAFETLALAPDDRVFYAVAGPDGAVLTGYDDLPPAVRVDPPGAGSAVGDGTFRGVPVRVAAARRYIPDAATPGWVRVALAQTNEARGALARDLTVKALALLAVMMLLGFLAALAAVRLALAPLARVERTMCERDPKDLAPLAIETPREIGALVGAINGFTTRLSRHQAVLQRFVAEASHQIRTPLAALSSQVEMLAWSETGTGPEAEERRARLTRIRARTRELARLTNQLLDHAMVSHRIESVPFAPVDLAEIGRQVLRDAASSAVGSLSAPFDLDLAFEGPETPVLVLGDAISLREALGNLVGNAIKHGARARLEIAVRDLGRLGEIAVIDDGPGIPPEDRERVTRPFEGGPGRGERGEGAQKGAGLGLSIASDVVAAHGGRLAFATLADGRFSVSLTIPAAVATARAA